MIVVFTFPSSNVFLEIKLSDSYLPHDTITDYFSTMFSVGEI